ncbi:MAG TPA: histidine kinase [Chitinophaga sp.]|uniref:sensor histidine kinase n=1 Tax=Chitinophaga sp. TaxID=1869181 RepID=UPI002DB8C13F|nr:histidine kinase [Chitinophaga sp.]HEU4551580.1 histidine kinase [Chitinophaga sp.]
MNDEWYTKKWVVLCLHILFWGLFFVFPYMLRPVMDDEAGPHRLIDDRGFHYLHLLNNLMRMLLFYANAFLFIPKLIYRKKYIGYMLVLMAALCIMLAWDHLFFTLLISGLTYKTWNFFVFNLPVFIFIIVASAAFRMIRDRMEARQRAKEQETEHLRTELAFLRSQVSPHFMFNVLNNMVALARKKSDVLEPSLIRLSSLLRYMLYETHADKVLLEKEIEYLESYIELQRQRFGKKVKIAACIQQRDYGYTIEPMLLIPFVENAFKHGTGLIPDAQISVHLTVQAGSLEFSVSNRYNDRAQEPKDKTAGIGLANVRRRLNLSYGNNHTLTIDKKDGVFTILLHLNLH